MATWLVRPRKQKALALALTSTTGPRVHPLHATKTENVVVEERVEKGGPQVYQVLVMISEQLPEQDKAERLASLEALLAQNNCAMIRRDHGSCTVPQFNSGGGAIEANVLEYTFKGPKSLRRRITEWRYANTDGSTINCVLLQTPQRHSMKGDLSQPEPPRRTIMDDLMQTYEGSNLDDLLLPSS